MLFNFFGIDSALVETVREFEGDLNHWGYAYLCGRTFSRRLGSPTLISTGPDKKPEKLLVLHLTRLVMMVSYGVSIILLDNAQRRKICMVV